MDVFWFDYEKYGYTDDDFQDNVVADVEYKEVIEHDKPLGIDGKTEEVKEC